MLLTLGLGIGGGLLLWAAFPPLDLPWLAWVAPVAWLWLIRSPKLPGRQAYAVLWLAGFVHWLCMLYGVRLAHPALNAGWLALAAYLGVYLPAFVGLTRVAVHRLRISLVVAAPVVWVGLELLRGHLITGFSLGLLAHTQAEFPLLIQVSDLGGGYTLSFVIMLVAACLAQMLPSGAGILPAKNAAPSPKAANWKITSLWPIAPVLASLAIVIAYGNWRLSQTPPGNDESTARVALIQGSLDTVFEVDPERVRQTYYQYNDLTTQAVTENPNLDLVIWPESMFMIAERIVDQPPSPPPEARISANEFQALLAASQSEFQLVLANEAALANKNSNTAGNGTLLMFGTTSVVYGAQQPHVYNSALLANRDGQIVGRYYKTHPVMFGEYIPFGNVLPWLYKVTPLPGGLSVGDGPKAFEVAGLRISPSICFESTVPHLIRGQLLELERRGTPADVLVNVSNDGWFWGSAILDLHFRCGIFRAVENRKPLLVAANTGISTWVDGNGVVRQRGERRKPQVLIAEVQADGRSSPYHWLGDLPANLCALACLGLALVGSLRRPMAGQAESVE